MIVLAVVILIAAACCAENETYVNEGLLLHNEYRSRHLAPNLELDPELNERASECAEYYAQKGTIDHSCPYKGDVGENLAWTMSSLGSPSESVAVKRAVRDWYNEIKDYNYEYPLNSTGVTGHFTQVVWRDSKLLGLASYRDLNSTRTYTCALYSPKGNVWWIGHDMFRFYRENVMKPEEIQDQLEDGTNSNNKTLVPPTLSMLQSLDS